MRTPPATITVFGIVVCCCLRLPAPAAPVPYWFDGYDVSTSASDVNFEIGVPRQGGTPVPLPYVTAGIPVGQEWRAQVFGPGSGTQPLQLAGSGAVHTLVTPNHSFTGVTGSSVIGKKVSVSVDAYVNNTGGTYFTFAAVTLAGSPLQRHDTKPDGLSVVFIEDTFGGNGNFIQIWQGNTLVDNLVPNPAGAGMGLVEFLIDDPLDGDPWDGVGMTEIEVRVNGVPVGFTRPYTIGGGGLTAQYITLEGSDQKFGAATAAHLFENLTVFSDSLPTSDAYYLSSSMGNDVNTGLDPSQAWASFTNLDGQVLAPGARVFLKRGDVWPNQQLHLEGKGTAANPILLSAYGEGALPVITGINLTNEACIVWENPSHVKIDSMHCKDAKIGLYLRFAGGNTDGSGAMFNNEDVHVTCCYFENMDEEWSDASGEIEVVPPFELSWGAGIWLGGNIPAPPGGPWASESTPILDDVSVTQCGFDRVNTGLGTGFYFPSIYRSRFTNFRFEDSWVTGCENGAFALFFVDGGHAKRIDTWIGGTGFYGTGSTAGFIQSSRNFLIEDCEFAGNLRTATMNDGVGFDIEGDCESITVRRSVFHDNAGGAFLVLNSGGYNDDLLLEDLTAWNDCRNPREGSRSQNSAFRYAGNPSPPNPSAYGTFVNSGIYLGADVGVGDAAGFLSVYDDPGDWADDFAPLSNRTATPWSSVNGRPHCWPFTASTEGWGNENHWGSFGWAGGALMGTATDVDPYVESPATWVNCRERRWVRVRMSSTAGTLAQVFFQTETDPAFTADKTVSFTVIPDGVLREYQVDMGLSTNYQGVVTKWRIDPTDQPGANLAIDEFCSEADPYLISASLLSSSELEVTFNQALLPAGEVLNPTNFTLSGLGQGTAGPHPDLVSVVCTPDGFAYRLIWKGGHMNGGEVMVTAAHADDPRGNTLYPGSQAILESINGLDRSVADITDIVAGPVGVLLAGTGTTGGLYRVVSSPDLSVPVATWPAVHTNVFGPDGSFSELLPRNPAETERYYAVEQP